MMAAGGGHGTNLFKDITFIGFDDEKNACGKRQRAIATNPLHSDYHPISHWEMIEFRDTTEAALIWMSAPNPAWINLDDCGTFQCTGLYNTVAKFERTTFRGSPAPTSMPQNFQVIPNNPESASSQVIPNCVEKIDMWNGWFCRNDDLGVMLIDSRDADRKTRNQQPLYI